MQLPRLELTNTMAQLGIKQHRATMEMKQPMAEIKMNQPQPEVEMYKSKSKFEIDQTEAFADANLKNPLRVVKEWASKAKQKLMQGIAEEVGEGKRLMSIEKQKTSIIPQISKEESEPPPKEFGFGYMPKSTESVKFHYQPSELQIKVKKGEFQIDIKPNYPIIKFNSGDLQIYLKQKASLQIQAVGSTIDQKL